MRSPGGAGLGRGVPGGGGGPGGGVPWLRLSGRRGKVRIAHRVSLQVRLLTSPTLSVCTRRSADYRLIGPKSPCEHASVDRTAVSDCRRRAGTVSAHVRRVHPRAVRQDRQPHQAARVRLPVGRDLRRIPLHLRLRAARRAAAAQREGRLVAVHGAAARRRRGPRRLDPVAAAGVGGLRAPRQLHRPARRLHQLQEPVPPRQAGRP